MWSVILELADGRRRVLSEHLKEAEAQAIGLQASEHYRPVRGAKVLLRTPGSSDQVQITAKGDVVRDQPELPAFGQDIVVHVPTATVKART